jgi:hypothetical protein
LRCAAFGVLNLLLVSSPVVARHAHRAAALPAHNFVNVDLTAPAPAPPAPGTFRLSVVLFDSASVVHNGDTVTFDALAISKTFGRYYSGNKEVGAPEGSIVFNTERFRASCGWRTLRRIPTPATPYEVGERYQPFAFQPQNLQDWFVAPFSQFTTLIDKICEGQPLGAAKGFGSIAAAVDAWKDKFSALPTLIPRIAGAPPAQASMESPASARLRVIATDGSNGNTLLLDTANVAHAGQTATAQSFAVLGPDAQRLGGEYLSVAALRTVRYDCAARTMTVIAQVNWDRSERLAGATQAAFAPRGASESPVIKAEIDTACGNTPPPSGAEYATVQAAWHAARDGWPPPATDTWLPCLWNGASADGKDAYLAQWTGAPDEKRFQPQAAEIQVLIAACAIPQNYADFALDKLRFYATERAALQRLAARELDEARILAAWRDLGWTERLHLSHDFHSFETSDIEDQLAFQDSFATSLGLRSGDAAARKWLGDYLYAQAWIEGA